MRFTYLLLNAFTISVPLFRSFEPRIQFYKKWKYFLPANLITAIFFLVWDYFKTKYGVWQFNNAYITGIRFFGLPIEEYLFFFTVPYACLFIYESVWLFIKSIFLPQSIKWLFIIISISAVCLSPFYFHKAYTFSVLFIGGIVWMIAASTFTREQLEKFTITFAISVVPMFLVNGFLTALPVVIYNNSQNLGIRIGTIPVEDFAYSSILLLMNIGLYEWQRSKQNKTSNISLLSKKSVHYNI